MKNAQRRSCDLSCYDTPLDQGGVQDRYWGGGMWCEKGPVEEEESSESKCFVSRVKVKGGWRFRKVPDDNSFDERGSGLCRLRRTTLLTTGCSV